MVGMAVAVPPVVSYLAHLERSGAQRQHWFLVQQWSEHILQSFQGGKTWEWSSGSREKGQVLDAGIAFSCYWVSFPMMIEEDLSICCFLFYKCTYLVHISYNRMMAYHETAASPF